MKCLFWALLCTFVPFAAIAANAWQYSKQIERSMVVTGTLEVNRDGSVHGYMLNQQEKLLPEVVEVIGRTVPTWKFEPIVLDSNLTTAKTTMSIRVVADKLDGDRYALSVRGVSFSDCNPGDTLSYKDQKPPRYPDEAVQARVGGTVYLVALVDRHGTVDDVAAYQVNLRAMGDNYTTARLRKDLAQASLDAVKKWTFNVPQQAKSADDHWRVEIPVNFVISPDGRAPPHMEYGRWEAYVPGPIEQIPWLESQEQKTNGSVDAIPLENNGLAFQNDSRFVLTNPPDNG